MHINKQNIRKEEVPTYEELIFDLDQSTNNQTHINKRNKKKEELPTDEELTLDLNPTTNDQLHKDLFTKLKKKIEIYNKRYVRNKKPQYPISKAEMSQKQLVTGILQANLTILKTK
jgi:hypothetical protein